MPLKGVPPVSLALWAHDKQGFAQAMGASFARFGFAVIADHGLDQGLIDRALGDVKAFFALPEEAKRAYFVPGGKGQRGYTPYKTEIAKGASEVDLKEFWHVGRELPAGHPYRSFMPENLWPADVAGFRENLWGLFTALDQLGGKLLEGVALYLDLPQTYFAPTVKDGNSILRLLHYPPMPPNPSGVRAGAHEDINVITLLLGAEEAGLQLLDKERGWIDIAPPPGCLVVNIGDMLQRLTNHRLPSTTHRVVNPAPERAHLPRYSIPYFLHFAPEFEIKTLPNCIDADHPNRYPTPITAQAYLEERLREIGLG
jgi:isopenicillin N synthase-like dioxygenase